MTPVLAGREGGIVLWLWQISQQTFWTFLEQASGNSVEVEGERYTQQGRVGGLWEEVLEWVMNASGMLQECRIGLFRGGLLSGGRCGLRGNHGIIIPSLLTFFFQHTCIKHFHRHILVERGKFKG